MQVFQSTPAIADGRTGIIEAVDASYKFQSTPAIADGRTPLGLWDGVGQGVSIHARHR